MIFLYDQQHGDQAIDSFAIKKEKIKELLERKTNPFVLYRGWLEWQLQRTTDYLKAVDQQIKGIGTKEGMGNVSYSTLLQAKQQAALWGLHWIRNLNRLVLPDEGLMAIQESKDNRRIWKGQDWFARISTHTCGNKRYELTDHRGNVMAVVSDRKTGVDATGDGRVDYYEPEVISASDYTPFGESMTGRNTNASLYRYGYNGKENDNEIKGEGNHQDYGFRIYDPRLGRFLSVDPLHKQYPYYTPYQFSGNTPIQAIDLDGLEPIGYNPTGKGSKKSTVTVIPGSYDCQASEGAFDGYKGLINAYAVQDIDKKTYLIFEAVNGNIQWYVEYDKDGWKGNVNEFTWSTPPNPANTLTAMIVTPMVCLPALGVMTPAAMEFLSTAFSQGLLNMKNLSWGQTFIKEASKKVLAVGGDISKVDWFDVTTSTIASKLGFGIVGKSMAELTNAGVDINISDEGVTFRSIGYGKKSSSIILDLTFSAFKTLVGEIAKGTSASKPSEEAMKMVFDQMKNQIKESINAQLKESEKPKAKK